MRRSGTDDDRLAQAATVHSSEDVSLDATLPSGETPRVDLTQATISPAPGDEPVLERGTSVGRYVVLDRLGSGTMGVVMAAIDPTLDRKVAIKLVKADRSGSTVGRQRLLREAQAMARLAHPNVVTIYEVGTFGERVFLAMEYIRGTTLAGWLGQTTRTRREIVSAFLAAGHGLAAAHRAGIVHRDFKPANTLVGDDGRVRVADFGLATAPEVRASSSPMPAVDPEAADMTSTGALLGTPTYMAPEQHRGRGADARADQFAFCVALYEALYRELPFEGKEYPAYAEHVMKGELREPPRGSRVPAWIRRVLVRGLAVEPDARYPSMDALLADLARDPVAARVRAGVVGVGLAIVATAIVVVARGHGAGGDPCAAAAQPLAGLWSASQRTTLAQALERSPTTLEHVTRALDQRVTALREGRREACRATAVRHEQSEELLDRRMQCIDQRAAETENLIGVLSDRPDAATIGKAAEAIAVLPAIASCADRSALLAILPPPNAPEARVQLAKLDRELARFEALEAAGKYREAARLTAALLPQIDAFDYAPLRAHAHYDDALARANLGEANAAATELRRTGELAAAAHDDALLAKTWISLYVTLGYRLARLDEAKSLEPTVAAAVVRAGSPAEVRGTFELARGAVALAAGDYQASANHYLNAARDYTTAFGPNHPHVSAALGNAGTALAGAGRYAEARTQLERALAVRIETLGPDNPNVSTSYYQLGDLLDTMEEPQQALSAFQKALAIDEAVFGKDSPHVAQDLVSVGVVLVELGRAKEALDDHLRAVEIFEQHPVDSEAKLATALEDLATTYRALERTDEALRVYERALAFAIKKYGPDHLQVAGVAQTMALAELNAGHAPRARELWRQALAIREKVLGPDHPEVAKSLGTLAEEAYDRGAYAEALPPLDRAIPILEKAEGQLALVARFHDMRGRVHAALHHEAEAVADFTRARDGYIANKLPAETAEVRLWLADASWAQGAAHHAAAVAEATTALAELQARPEPDAAAIKKTRAWLARHR